MNNEIVSELERLPPDYKLGTSKLYSPNDFEPSTGDALRDLERRARSVVGRDEFLTALRTHFGPPDSDGGYVFRHRASGLVITAYSAQSGPSFGGGPCYPETLPATENLAQSAFKEAFERQKSAMARLASDALLGPLDKLTPEQRGIAMHGNPLLMARQRELLAPPGFTDIVRRLNALLKDAQTSVATN